MRSQGTAEFVDMIVVERHRQHWVDSVSKEVGNIIRMVNLVVLSTMIASFGIVANVINMIVFQRQGFTTSSNISFFALALSDMMCLVGNLTFAALLNPYLEASNINFIPEEIQHLTSGWLHICFCRITSWITVCVTAERCIGITLPLKVKQIITLRRTSISMCFIFAVNLAFLLPEYATIYWDFNFVPEKNRSLLGVKYRSYRNRTKGVSFAMTSISGCLSFLCVIFLTIFLVTKLTQKSKWRKKATGRSDNSEAVSTRDRRTMKMIILIASILIVCYIPGTATSFVSCFVPDFNIGQSLIYTYFSCWSTAFLCDTVNSSVNVFIYYRMSTKYRQTFNELFARRMRLDTQ